MSKVRDALARAGLVDELLEPHEPHAFESAMHLLFNPGSAGASAAATPNIVTPTSSARCARAGCDRPSADPIHRIPED